MKPSPNQCSFKKETIMSMKWQSTLTMDYTWQAMGIAFYLLIWMNSKPMHIVMKMLVKQQQTWIKRPLLLFYQWI